VKLSLVLCSIIGALGLLACASSPKDNPVTDASLATPCVKNQTLRCQCNLSDGVQTCGDDGKLSECKCTNPKPNPNPNPNPNPTGTTTSNPPPPVNTCGDSVIDKGEACDDGNTLDGDGCSSACQPDGAPAAADTCPGQAVTLWKGSTLILAGSTETYNDDVSASCVPSPGPDRIYAVQPSADGFMSLSAIFAPGFDAIVEVRRDTCDSSNAQVLCNDTFSTAFQNVIQVNAGHTYYVIVDSDSSAMTGAYTIHLELP
jgi:cysteine-rich repeat protein